MKKKIFRFLYQLLCVIITVFAGVMACVIFFRIEDIEVHGSTKYSEEQIVSIANISSKANLLTIRASQISEKLQEDLPYVNQVTVRRQLPSVLHIDVQEALPTAWIQSGGSWFVLGSNGKVLEEVEASMTSEYIQIVGITLLSPKVGDVAKASEDESRRLTALFGLLSALNIKKIADDVGWIDLSKEIEIEMDYMGKYVVRLPINTEHREWNINSKYGRKMDILVSIVEYLDETDRGVIDLRQNEAYFRPR